MHKAEVISGGLVLAFGIVLLAGAMRFPFFLDGIPGPGFLPLLIAFGVCGSGIVIITGSMRGAILTENPRWAAAAGWRRVAYMLGAMTVAFLLLDLLGFLIVTTLFMAAMIYALGERSWRMLATVPVLSAIALYAVFAVWLRVPLPKGILTFID